LAERGGFGGGWPLLVAFTPPLETRLFSAAVIAALNLFLAMFFTMALLVAYFYLPKVANGA
jgi:hypothetical protein